MDRQTIQRFFDKSNQLVNSIDTLDEESLAKLVSRYADVFVLCSHGLPVDHNGIWILNEKIRKKFGKQALTLVKLGAQEIFHKDVAQKMARFPEFEALLAQIMKEADDDKGVSGGAEQ